MNYLLMQSCKYVARKCLIFSFKSRNNFLLLLVGQNDVYYNEYNAFLILRLHKCVFSTKYYNDTSTDSETKHSLGATIFSVISP